MKDLSTVNYHPIVQELAEILCYKTQNSDPQFFRIQATYYLTKIASMMRCSVTTVDRGNIPVSIYAINLALSGYGKGFSTNILEEQVIAGFKDRFLNATFDQVAKKNLDKIAFQRANRGGTSSHEELERINAEYELAGVLAFSFDSGTPAAIKQMRHKLLLADAGSLNLEIDEIGSTLVGHTDILNPFLELYDVGKIKQKLIKNTKDSIRNEEIDGRTPTNMLLFGTPRKLLDGGKTEEDFYSMLETGYARRCLFGYSRDISKKSYKTPQELYDMHKNVSTAEAQLQKITANLRKLADPINFKVELPLSKTASLLYFEYRTQCERAADLLPEHKEIQKAELAHRYFKTTKFAGAYAFADSAVEVTEEHMYQAIKLTEDSGVAFNKILTRDRNYVRLARYIAEEGVELTHADIQEDLPFYKGGAAHRADLLNMAIAWGYKNNVIIKKTYDGDIEFLTGEMLEETDLDKLIVSYSTKITTEYTNEVVKWKDLHVLTQSKGYHFVGHHLLEED